MELIWRILPIVTLVVITSCTGVRRGGVPVPTLALKPPLLDRQDSITTYSCEGTELHFGCEEGKLIRLIRANYGRFSIQLCNDNGAMDWSVTCMSYRSFPIVQSRCTQKQNCTVPASSSLFHDTCPGTIKYLEVQYQCEYPSYFTSTTKKSLVLANNFSPTDSDLAPETTVAAAIETSNGSASAVPVTKYSTTSSKPTSTTTTTTTTTTTSAPSTRLVTTTRSTTTLEITTHRPATSAKVLSNYCPPTLVNDMQWNWTKAGTEAVVRCPGGASGLARWQCGSDPVRWLTPFPDMRECRSGWVSNLKKKIESGDSLSSVATELALMSDIKSLYADDLKEIAEMTQQMLFKTTSIMENNHESWRIYQVIRELLQLLVKTVSHLLDQGKRAWKDLSGPDRRRVASSLLDGIEGITMILAKASGKEDAFTMIEPNVFLSVQVVQLLSTTIPYTVRFPTREDFRGLTEESAWVRMEDSLVLPAEPLHDIGTHGLGKVVFFAYNGIGEILKPEPGYLPHTYRSYYASDTNINSSWRINSKVIAASMSRERMMELPQPVIITLRHLQEENMTNPVCVFWDFDLREWSNDGCWVQASNYTHTTCSCDHLTHFAVMMEVAEVKQVPITQDVLHVTITIGCGICICCLILTIVPIFLLRSLKGDSVTIHRNIFLCLLLAEIVLLTGIEQTWEPVLCAILAALLDYLLLATICWAFLECFELYVELADISQPQKSRWAWYYGLAYSVPAVIVSVAAIVDCKSYGTVRLCWLRADNYFIFSFIGPAVGIYFGGMVFLCVASCILYHHSSLTTTIKGKEEAKLINIKSNIRRAVLLMCILGLTWTTGLLYLHQETLSLAYAFTIFNSIQGIFILAFYCITDEKIQPEIERLSEFRLPAPLHRSKGNLPPPAALTPGSPGQHSEECQEVGSPIKQGNCTVNLTSTTLGPLYTTSTTNPIGENHASELPQPTPQLYGPLQKGPEIYNSTTGKTINQQESPCKVWLPYEWQRRFDRQYLGTGDLYGPFSEHIYESVDGDYGYAGHPRSIGGEYCYRSDVSQHSSSSYGYDQRPLLILPRHPGHGEYGIGRRHSPDKHRRRHRGHRRSVDDTKGAGDGAVVVVEQEVVTQPPEVNMEQPGEEQHEWNLPDLLRCPVDNTVVMAVLDGEKVVSRVQPECPHYNLSTYC